MVSCSTGDDTQMYDITVSTSPADAGSVSPTDTTIEEGEQLSLQADATDKNFFSHWSGDVDSTSVNPLSLTVDQDYSLNANFEIKSYELTINTDGEGTVDEAVLRQKSKEYDHGTVVELTASPAEGWKFVEWTGDIQGSDNPGEITVDDPKKVTAMFEEFPDSPFEGGDGSKTYPYKVSTIEQLQVINDYLDAHFVQINDIDASETENWNGGEGFKPLGDYDLSFTGSFNGQGNVITNLYINRSTGSAGLFGRTKEATINNVGLENVDITGSRRTGGLVGYLRDGSKIANSYTTGIIENSNSYLGGLVGRDGGGTIKNSYSTATINGSNSRWIGGLIGVIRGKVVNSYSNGKVTGYSDVGGLVGENRLGGEISNSYSTGDVTGSKKIGGLVGTNDEESVINSSYTVGEVTGDTDVGGLVGINASTIKNSYWNTESSNQSSAVGRGSSDGATGLTTSEMTGSSAEENMSDFDWDEIWVTTDSYPALFWE